MLACPFLSRKAKTYNEDLFYYLQIMIQVDFTEKTVAVATHIAIAM